MERVNAKKELGFVETPKQIIWIMQQWIPTTINETVADFTAGRGTLLNGYNKDKCYGIELDVGNYAILQEKGYQNIVQGDFFEKIDEFKDESIDNLLLNPPYGNLGKKKNSMQIINKSIDKIRTGGRIAIICQQGDFQRFKEVKDIMQKIKIGIAYKFGNNLFKPYASPTTILLIGKKEIPDEKNKVIVIDVPNDRIEINTRVKHPEPKLNIRGAKEAKIKQKDLFLNVDSLFLTNEDITPKLEDFRKTVIDYIAFEYKIPIEILQNPKPIFEGLNRLINDLTESADDNI